MRTFSFVIYFFTLILIRTTHGLFGTHPLSYLGKLVLWLPNDMRENNATLTPARVPVTLQIPTLDEVEYYVHFAAAVYCSGSPLLSWTCEECRATGASVQLVKVISGGVWANTQGVLAISHEKHEIVIVFRGTYNLFNALQDLKVSKVSSPFVDEPTIELHKGMLGATNSLYEQVLNLTTGLLSSYPGYTVVLAGHSLGGALAAITFYKLKHDCPPETSFAVYTYGEPRVGNEEFADWMNSQSIKYGRVVNEADIIPHALYAGLGFAHHHTELWTHNGVTKACTNRAVYEDPACSNSLTEGQLSVVDHLSYLGVSIGLNFILENPIRALWDIVTG